MNMRQRAATMSTGKERFSLLNQKVSWVPAQDPVLMRQVR